MRATVFLLSTILFLACNKSDTQVDPSFNQEISWTLGADYTGDTTILVSSAVSAASQWEISRYSLCPNHQVRLTILSEQDDILFEATADTTVQQALVIPTGQPLKLKAELVPVENGVVCIWLGQVAMNYRYVK